MCLVIAIYSASVLAPIHREVSLRYKDERESLYLPNGDALALLSFGYKSSLAHLLWFQTIDYFGRHYESDQNYRWLAHMCDLVTTLSPQSAHVYQFCSTMLSWEAKSPELSITLLDKAINNLPRDWRFPYLRGITHLFFLQDREKARTDFIQAAQLPDAHSIVKRLAAKSLAETSTPETAIEFLNDLIQQEQDPSARQALEYRREELRRSITHHAHH